MQPIPMYVFPQITIEVNFTKKCNRTGEETDESRLIDINVERNPNFAKAIENVQDALSTLGYSVVRISTVKVHENEEK